MDFGDFMSLHSNMQTFLLAKCKQATLIAACPSKNCDYIFLWIILTRNASVLHFGLHFLFWEFGPDTLGREFNIL